MFPSNAYRRFVFFENVTYTKTWHTHTNSIFSEQIEKKCHLVLMPPFCRKKTDVWEIFSKWHNIRFLYYLKNNIEYRKRHLSTFGSYSILFTNIKNKSGIIIGFFFETSFKKLKTHISNTEILFCLQKSDFFKTKLFF